MKIFLSPKDSPFCAWYEVSKWSHHHISIFLKRNLTRSEESNSNLLFLVVISSCSISICMMCIPDTNTDRQPGSQVGKSRDSIITQRVQTYLVCQTNEIKWFGDLFSFRFKPVFFTKVGWEPDKLKAIVDPGRLPGCHLVRNGNSGGIYLGLKQGEDA